MTDKQQKYEIVIQNICKLLKEKNLQQKELCEALKLKNKSFTEWKSGRSTSYMKKLPEIAEYFGVSTEYLLGNDDKEKTPTEYSEGEKMLLDLFRQIPEEQQKAFLEMGRVYANSLKKG